MHGEILSYERFNTLTTLLSHPYYEKHILRKWHDTPCILIKTFRTNQYQPNSKGKNLFPAKTSVQHATHGVFFNHTTAHNDSECKAQNDAGARKKEGYEKDHAVLAVRRLAAVKENNSKMRPVKKPITELEIDEPNGFSFSTCNVNNISTTSYSNQLYST